MDVAPGPDELAAAVAVGALGPRVPAAVHLLREAQAHGRPVGGDLARPARDVGVEVAGDDARAGGSAAGRRAPRRRPTAPRRSRACSPRAATAAAWRASKSRDVGPVGEPHDDVGATPGALLEGVDLAQVGRPPADRGVAREGERRDAQRDPRARGGGGALGGRERPLGPRGGRGGALAGAGPGDLERDQGDHRGQQDDGEQRAAARTGGHRTASAIGAHAASTAATTPTVVRRTRAAEPARRRSARPRRPVRRRRSRSSRRQDRHEQAEHDDAR